MRPAIWADDQVLVAASDVIFRARRVVDAWRPTVPEISTIADLARAVEEYDQVASERARHL